MNTITPHSAKHASVKEAQSNYLNKMLIIDTNDLKLVEKIKQLQDKVNEQIQNGEKQ